MPGLFEERSRVNHGLVAVLLDIVVQLGGFGLRTRRLIGLIGAYLGLFVLIGAYWLLGLVGFLGLRLLCCFCVKVVKIEKKGGSQAMESR